MKVGDYIQHRRRADEVYQVEAIELTLDETMLHEAGNLTIRRRMAVMPFLRLKAPPGAPYPDGFTEHPEDFKVMEGADWSSESMTKLKAAWRGGLRVGKEIPPLHMFGDCDSGFHHG